MTMSEPQAARRATKARGAIWRRAFSYVLPFIVVGSLWQVASQFFPPYLFPSLVEVFKRCIGILVNWDQLSDVLTEDHHAGRGCR